MSLSTAGRRTQFMRWRQQRATARRGVMLSLTTSDPASAPNQPVRGRLVPKPRVPPRPVLSLGAFGLTRKAGLPCLLDHGPYIEVTSGRAAIALALVHMGVQPGDQVLIPAYHCPAMVDPVVWAKGEPVFYRLKPDLSADLDDVQAKLSGKSRALMAVHFFGFPQPLEALRAFCDRNELVMIEDCAHSAFGSYAGRPLGSFGDYAVACHTKFFPTFEGGALLVRRSPDGPIRLKAANPAFELNAAVSVIHRSLSYERLWALEPFMSAAEFLARAVRSSVKRGHPDSEVPVMEAGIPGQFAAGWVDTRMSLFSRLLCRTLSWRRIVERRRSNYCLMAKLIEGIPGVTPLHRELPDGVVPHVFPVAIRSLDALFARLEDAGVPMQRFGQFLWQGVDEGTCPVSAGLSRQSVQLSCHQDLSAAEIAWIVEQVRTVVSEIFDHGES